MNYPNGVTLENVPCPLGCSDGDEILFSSSDRLCGVPGDFSVSKCKGCGLQRTTPRPTQSTIGAYYPESYAPYSGAKPRVRPTILRSVCSKFLGFRAKMLPRVQGRRMLEVGCSNGTYLLEMAEEGWCVEGLEYSVEAAEAARKFGLNVVTGTVESAMFEKDSYDIIAAWMVLEHLHDPVGTLARLRDWVKPEGYLVASVPDVNSLARRIFKEACYDVDLPRHLYHFNKETLKRVLDKAGWELERIVWQKNCVTPLKSLEFYAHERGRTKLSLFTRWFLYSNLTKIPRFALSWVLGITRSSGRIEFWARPKSDTRQL